MVEGIYTLYSMVHRRLFILILQFIRQEYETENIEQLK